QGSALESDRPLASSRVHVGAARILSWHRHARRRVGRGTLDSCTRSARAARDPAGTGCRCRHGRRGGAMTDAIGIRGIAYALPAVRRVLSELETLGQLRSEPKLLEQFGFAEVSIAVEETP